MNFQVELHNFCNFSCGYCPHRLMQRKQQFMTDAVFEKILYDYIVPYRYHNAFCPPTFICHKDSEPLIDRKLPARLKMLASAAPDMKIDVYSNGVLLPTWAKRGEDFIQFLASLPNHSRYLMSFHPVNHDYTTNDYGPVIAYLKEVLRNKPHNIEFISVSHRSKWVSDLVQDSWVAEWQGYPITVHKNCSINPWTGLIAEENTIQFNGCPYGDFGHVFIGVTGNIITCCLDLEEEIVLGNVLTHAPDEMMKKLHDFYAEQRRRQQAKERPEYAVCDNCFGYDRRDKNTLIQLGL